VDPIDGNSPIGSQGERIAGGPMSTNYTSANKAVFVPTYEDPNDACRPASNPGLLFRTTGWLASRVAAIFLSSGGSIGCITQPQYAGGQTRAARVTDRTIVATVESKLS